MLFVADLNPSKNFAKSGQQLFFELVIELRSAFRERIKKWIENWLGKSIKILFEEVIVFFLILDW